MDNYECQILRVDLMTGVLARESSQRYEEEVK